MKNLFLVLPILLFGIVRESYAHRIRYKTARISRQTKIFKRVQFLPTHASFLKSTAILITLFSSLYIYAEDNYITTADLHLRSGAGKGYSSITVISKGDTVKLLESSGGYWAKIQFEDKIGYSAEQYIQEVHISEPKIETASKSGVDFVPFLIFALILMVSAIILKRKGEKYRYKSTTTVLSFFFGTFGFQKFYLGEKNKGIYSILFCWTFIPTIIGLFDFIKFAVMNEANFIRLYNWGKITKARKAPYAAKPNLNESSNTDNFLNQRGQSPTKAQSIIIDSIEDTSFVAKPIIVETKKKQNGYGDIFEKELCLDKKEISWLNQIKAKSNDFFSIDGCGKIIIKSYIQLLYQLLEKLAEFDTTLEKEIKGLERLVIKDFKIAETGGYDWDKYEGDFIFKEIEVFNNLFRKTENAVREAFICHKKLNEEFKYLPLILTLEFNKKIGNFAVELLSKILNDMQSPDIETQIELNRKFKNRWKIEFEELIRHSEKFKTQTFLEKLSTLEAANRDNPNIGSIFYEASKVLALVDNENALKLYAKCIYYDEKFKRFQFRNLPKRIEDMLFKTANQRLEYIHIEEELRKTLNLSHAYLKIEEILSENETEIHQFIQSEIEKVDIEVQGFAKNAYPDDTSMQEYVYSKQIESKQFILTAKDEELLVFAKAKYPDDYVMQEYVYKEQSKSKEYLSSMNDKEILSFSLKQHPHDYAMQAYVYEKQAKSKAFMKEVSNENLKLFAVAEHPDDYFMQEYIYNEKAALASAERPKLVGDNSIIDINSENLDLSVEQNKARNKLHFDPPVWNHTYIYSYDEIRHATAAQKKYYFHLKNRVLNGEVVDIKGNTNYAFLLYFDFLKEYQNHNDIDLLDKQLKLLSEICPKTRSYSLRSLQDELRKRNDPYSINKLRSLEDPNYQLENGYSDYFPDLYKLGNQYKEKLGLTKQEVRWLNKFYNPTNVFLSIEGCCIAAIMQYLSVLKELEKELEKKEATLTKEVTYFKEELKTIYLKRNSDWGYYDTSFVGNQAESEIYLTIFKRVENSVRDLYGHKRKVSGDFPNADINLSEEFENRLGNTIDKLILELKVNVIEPDLDTQIALNTQNVNRWKSELDILKNNYTIDEQEKFIDAIVLLEEANHKNPNIENIFFDASKFISKYDKVQALKYYAKYIYYDLKSVKFDNKELTKTVQKSLFRTDDQINDFREILADLIKTGDIQTAQDKIARIYVPKRKKINLDRSEIKAVEQKHEGTVELLNGYLVDEKHIAQFEIEEDFELAVISVDENDSIFISEISMSRVQEDLVKMIIGNSYKIPQETVDKYATKHGMFKNQLIDSINEACEELLNGEALLEEEDESYIIEESYFKEIRK